MHTNIVLNRSETRSVSIAAPAGEVFGFLADPENIPRWAPGFASAIRPDGERWIVTNSAGELPVVIASDAGAGTVDILRDADRTTGAFARVVPNGAGSEMLFTLFFSPRTPEDAVAGQMATVDEELATVRKFAEGAHAG